MPPQTYDPVQTISRMNHHHHQQQPPPHMNGYYQYGAAAAPPGMNNQQFMQYQQQQQQQQQQQMGYPPQAGGWPGYGAQMQQQPCYGTPQQQMQQMQGYNQQQQMYGNQQVPPPPPPPLASPPMSPLMTPPQPRPQEPPKDLIEPHENDILMGRGGKNNMHVGNERLREMARNIREEYHAATKKGKSNMSRDLVQQIRDLKPPGRFLKRHPATNEWEDVGDEVAREKVSQVLRDAVSEFCGPKAMKKKQQEEAEAAEAAKAVADAKKEGTEAGDLPANGAAINKNDETASQDGSKRSSQKENKSSAPVNSEVAVKEGEASTSVSLEFGTTVIDTSRPRLDTLDSGISEEDVFNNEGAETASIVDIMSESLKSDSAEFDEAIAPSDDSKTAAANKPSATTSNTEDDPVQAAANAIAEADAALAISSDVSTTSSMATSNSATSASDKEGEEDEVSASASQVTAKVRQPRRSVPVQHVNWRRGNKRKTNLLERYSNTGMGTSSSDMSISTLGSQLSSRNLGKQLSRKELMSTGTRQMSTRQLKERQLSSRQLSGRQLGGRQVSGKQLGVRQMSGRHMMSAHQRKQNFAMMGESDLSLDSLSISGEKRDGLLKQYSMMSMGLSDYSLQSIQPDADDFDDFGTGGGGGGFHRVSVIMEGDLEGELSDHSSSTLKLSSHNRSPMHNFNEQYAASGMGTSISNMTMNTIGTFSGHSRVSRGLFSMGATGNSMRLESGHSFLSNMQLEMLDDDLFDELGEDGALEDDQDEFSSDFC